MHPWYYSQEGSKGVSKALESLEEFKRNQRGFKEALNVHEGKPHGQVQEGVQGGL